VIIAIGGCPAAGAERFIRTLRRRMLRHLRRKQEKDRVLLLNPSGFFDCIQ
jgi:hypothetical protein